MIETIWHSDVADMEAFFRYAGYRVRKGIGQPLGEAGDAMLDQVLEAFNTEGVSIGESWPEVTPEWRAVKNSSPFAGSTYLLRYTDKLIDAAIMPRHMAGSPVNVSVSDMEVEYRLDNPIYAHIHQYGARYGKPRADGRPPGIPARPFIKVTEELNRHVEAIFYNWLERLHEENAARRGIRGLVNPL